MPIESSSFPTSDQPAGIEGSASTKELSFWRDDLAQDAMAALIRARAYERPEELAHAAYEIADAMIAQSKREAAKAG